MAKAKLVYECGQCAAQYPKWSGQCGDCGEWNTLVESAAIKHAIHSRAKGYAGETSQVFTLSEVSTEDVPKIHTGLKEFDHVLGGGLVAGSVTLIGGDPGIGKSTLLLESVGLLSQNYPTLYVTGEESLQQISLRAKRLGIAAYNIQVLAQTHVETILATAKKNKPNILVIDSIQTMFTDTINSAPGGVSQLRESAALLVRFAKETQTAIFIVGHVTKDGALAGPRVLEHMVDTVLYFEGQSDSRYRVLRARKNRFGAVNELGVFAMTEKGLKEVTNPSAIFLTGHSHAMPGSVVMVAWEGSRPLLVEIQALVDESHGSAPRRVTVGIDNNRLVMLLAVMHRHGGVVMYDQDVFINAVGGVRVLETATDLACILSAYSSLRDRPLPEKLITFGEIGLAGEVRPVPNGQERLREAAKHGFKKAIIPKANVPKQKNKDFEVIGVSNIKEALEYL